jgi:hypothetical protein
MANDFVAIRHAILRNLPKPARTRAKGRGLDEVLRGLVKIGQVLSPDKPAHPRTVRRLIRKGGLPAFKRPGFGWISTRNALLSWVGKNLEKGEKIS